MNNFPFWLTLLLLNSTASFSQDRTNVKFGKITPQDFIINSPLINTDTKAVVIADIGNTSFVGNKKGGFSYIYKRQTRIKIVKKTALEPGSEIASVKIHLYKEDKDVDLLSDVNAVTYNLENGQVVETKLAKDNMFEDLLNKNWIEEKFTMPAAKEGSIFEISYTITSEFNFNLPSWQFQYEEYPCLWSEYQVAIPNLLIYAVLHQGFDDFYISKNGQGFQTYLVTDPASNVQYGAGGTDQDLSISAIVNTYRWVMKDVQPFQAETYISSPKNYLDKVEFQLSQTSNGEETRQVMNTWQKVAEDLVHENSFGGTLNDPNYFFDKDINAVTQNQNDQLSMTKSIFNCVRDNFTCTNYNWFLIQTSLRDVYNRRSGNVGEINLLLIAMLRKKGIYAEPVIMSTREHGFSSLSYPMLPKFNYLVCRTVIDGKVYYLDATHPHLGFGYLMNDCYNGYARIINSVKPDSIYFSTDSVTETKVTSAFIFNKENGGITAKVQSARGYFESYDLREKLVSMKEEDYFKDILKSYPFDADIDNTTIDSLKNFDEPVTINYDLNFKLDNDDIIYFNPMLSEQLKKNPFEAEARKYPVTMRSCTNETYVMNMEVPNGYKVDAFPKSARVKLNENDGVFEYIIQQSGNHIQLRSTIQIRKANFERDDYASLRNFFADVVKKQAEPIVFKKIN